jgi:hypothetical protein
VYSPGHPLLGEKDGGFPPRLLNLGCRWVHLPEDEGVWEQGPGPKPFFAFLLPKVLRVGDEDVKKDPLWQGLPLHGVELQNVRGLEEKVEEKHFQQRLVWEEDGRTEKQFRFFSVLKRSSHHP